MTIDQSGFREGFVGLVMLQDVQTGSTSEHTSWRPTEDVDKHGQGRPRAPLQTANLWLRTMEKGLVKVSSELALDRRAWSASIRDAQLVRTDSSTL